MRDEQREKREKRTGLPRKNIKTFVLIVLCALYGALCSSYASAVEIRSRAAVVMDTGTGRVLYAKNPELRLYPASTTKLMTALVTVEKADLKNIVTVSKRAALAAPTKVGLKAGDHVTVEALLYAALMKSANDASVALAESVAGSVPKFVKLMNHKAIALGIKDTRFINPNGLPGKGQYITAYDLAKIMRQVFKHEVLREILGTRVKEVSISSGRSMFIKNTNMLLWSDDDLLAGKTGYTRRARHCFAGVAEKGERSVIVALLGAPKRELLWQETERLMDFGYKVMNNLEKPVVYLTKSDYRAPKVVKASYTRKTKTEKYIKAKLKKARKKPIYR